MTQQFFSLYFTYFTCHSSCSITNSSSFTRFVNLQISESFFFPLTALTIIQLNSYIYSRHVYAGYQPCCRTKLTKQGLVQTLKIKISNILIWHSRLWYWPWCSNNLSNFFPCSSHIWLSTFLSSTTSNFSFPGLNFIRIFSPSVYFLPYDSWVLETHQSPVKCCIIFTSSLSNHDRKIWLHVL
jgi:hypothetical protein